MYAGAYFFTPVIRRPPHAVTIGLLFPLLFPLLLEAPEDQTSIAGILKRLRNSSHTSNTKDGGTSSSSATRA